MTDALGDDLRELRGLLDSLEKSFCSMADAFRRRGGHLASGHPSAVSWLRDNCKLSATSAADRLCLGKGIPPERPPLFMPRWRARGPGVRWAA